MEEEFRLKLRRTAHSILKLWVTAWNGKFGGSGHLFASVGRLINSAAELEGFPCYPTDQMSVVFGNFEEEDPPYTGGKTVVRF